MEIHRHQLIVNVYIRDVSLSKHQKQHLSIRQRCDALGLHIVIRRHNDYLYLFTYIFAWLIVAGA